MIEVAFSYITKFFYVVVVNCFAYPQNLPYCVRIDTWLVPDIVNHVGYLTGEKKAYDNEKKILQSIRAQFKSVRRLDYVIGRNEFII